MNKKVEEKLEKKLLSIGAEIGICVLNDDEILYCHKEKEIFDTACSIMAFIMVEYFNQKKSGKITGEELLEFKKENYATGAGTVKLLPYGTTIKAKDLLELMIIISDHIAANLIIDFLGIENINRCIKEIGMVETRLNHKFIIPKLKHMGYSTPYETALLYRLINTNSILDNKSCEEMRSILLRQKYKDILTDKIRESNSLNYIDCASKSGKADGRIYDDKTDSYIVDSGIIYTRKGNYYISVMGELSYNSNISLNNLKSFIQDISYDIYKAIVEE